MQDDRSAGWITVMAIRVKWYQDHPTSTAQSITLISTAETTGTRIFREHHVDATNSA